LKFKLNDYVYTINKFDEAIKIDQKRIKAINETCLGTIYDCLGTDNEIEICFESNLYTLEDLINEDFTA